MDGNTLSPARITFYSDAKAKLNRFGICDFRGRPLWHGTFFKDNREYNGEQSCGEMVAAKKAVWLASKVAEAVGRPVALTLKVDAQWLIYANKVAAGEKGGGKARALGILAQKLGVILTVEHVYGIANPADAYTICRGFKRWRDNDFVKLAGAQPQIA